MAFRLHLVLTHLLPLLHLLDLLGDPPWPSPWPQLDPDPQAHEDTFRKTPAQSVTHYSITLHYSALQILMSLPIFML